MTIAGVGIPEALAEFVSRDNSTERVVQSGKTDADGYLKLLLGDDAPARAHLRLTRPGEGPKFVGPEPISLHEVPSNPVEFAAEALQFRALGPHVHPHPFHASAPPACRIEAPCTSTS